MIIIALAGQKGGSGKSTTAICLAVEALRRRRRVLLVDADPQATAGTWAEVAKETGRAVPPVEAMQRPHEQLGGRAGAYDWVIIDCPGREDEVQRSTLMTADVVVLPCGLAAPDAWALSRSIEVVQAATSLRPALAARLLVARRHPRANSGALRHELAGTGVPALKTELTERAAYRDAIAAGQGVTTYAPESPGAAEIRALFTELEALGGAHGQATRQPAPRARRR